MRALLPILMLLLTGQAFAAEPLHGPVETDHGDGLHYAIRLWGIDAPEKEQRCRNTGGCYACGRLADEAMERMVRGKDIRCEPTGRRRHGRQVAICYDGWRDLSLAMLRQGWAVARGEHINDVPDKTNAYLAAQKKARNEGLGLWAGAFVTPKKWRLGERLGGCE